ncbi:hypothetical protein ECTX1999_3257 [Escherichia coli TX1999]|nr:hypothetical protein ECTX1999_3257 [Escherichia coli TX1999]EHW00052.1 hypothetical protein ECDEC7E_3121 [Escherichia coli DEC7E]
MFPAPAGINHADYRQNMGANRVPRASGDKPPNGWRSRWLA